MTKNVGTIDRSLRALVGLAGVGIAIAGVSAWGWLGLVPLLTAATGWCPPYSLFGFSTCARK